MLMGSHLGSILGISVGIAPPLVVAACGDLSLAFYSASPINVYAAQALGWLGYCFIVVSIALRKACALSEFCCRFR